MAKYFFNLILNYQKYFNVYYPPKKIKSAWYRFYFFIKPDIKNYKKLRYEIINNLKKNKIKCFTGSCPEIYLEKAFKDLKYFKYKRLINCKILGETSIALDVNHTLSYSQHKHNVVKMNSVLEKLFKR